MCNVSSEDEVFLSFFRDIIVRQRLYFLHLVGEFSPTEEFL